jgi:L-fucose mutarotase
MLKGIPALLTADLLHALRSMGRGDEIAIVDANFPASNLGPPAIEVPVASAADALAAILAVFPVDAAANPAAITMEVDGDPDAVPPPVAEFAGVLTDCGLADCEIGHLARAAFEDRAAEAFAIVRTGELRPYGNILLVKGAVHEPVR